jgi:dTDP-4-amino-4,6-dideoxygalactose transaminase
MDELQAAILRAKLPYLEADNARRREIVRRYDEGLADLPLRRPAALARTTPAPHLYPVLVPSREALREHLAGRGIETGIHYPVPIHLQPAYAFLGHSRGDFPVSEEASETVLSLPLYPTLADDQVEAVISAVRDFFGRPR